MILAVRKCSFAFFIVVASIWRCSCDGGIFNDQGECAKSCVGDHDLNCVPIKGGGPQRVCKCHSSFYSVQQTCDDECGNGQYWSLFTYGSCSAYTSNVLPGACNIQCVFRIRVWATVFIIILFVAAVIIIMATLPNCILNCIACLNARKQGRTIEDMHVAGAMGGGQGKQGGFESAAHQMAAVVSPWHQPNYGYYSQSTGRA